MRSSPYGIMSIVLGFSTMAAQALKPGPDLLDEFIVTGSLIAGDARERIARPVDVTAVEDIAEPVPRKLEAEVRVTRIRFVGVP